MLSDMVKIHTHLAKTTVKQQIDSGMVIKDDEIPPSMREALLSQSNSSNAKPKEKGKGKPRSRKKASMGGAAELTNSVSAPMSQFSGSSAQRGSPVDHVRMSSHPHHLSPFSPPPPMVQAPQYSHSMSLHQSHAYQPTSSGPGYMTYAAENSDGNFVASVHPPTSYPEAHHRRASPLPDPRSPRRSPHPQDTAYRLESGADRSHLSASPRPVSTQPSTPPGAISTSTSNALAAAAAAMGQRNSVTLPSISELLPTSPFAGRPPTAGGMTAPPMPPPELPATQYADFYDGPPTLPGGPQHSPQFQGHGYYQPPRQPPISYLPEHAQDPHYYSQPHFNQQPLPHYGGHADPRNGYQVHSPGPPFASSFGYDAGPSHPRDMSHPQ